MEICILFELTLTGIYDVNIYIFILICCSHVEISYYRQNKGTPYFNKGNNQAEYDIEQLVEILLLTPDRKRICHQRPIGCQENASFVIDTSALKDFEDYKADDLGSFRNHGNKAYVVTTNGKEVMSVSALPKNWPPLKPGEILVKKTYWVHSSDKSFKRKSTELRSFKDEPYDLVFLQYTFDGEPHPINKAPHGNAKKCKRPFIPTSKSTRQRIGSQVFSKSGPSKIFDDVFQESGGVIGISAFSDVPRDNKQVKYIRSTTRQKKENDEVASLIDKAKADNFVHSLQLTPNIRFVLANDSQICDIKDYCCGIRDFSILGIDTTYNISKKYYFTPMTYRHPKLLDRQSGQHPVIPGPALIHDRLDATNFRFFANCLVEKDNELTYVRAIGSDRDAAVDKGLKSVFSSAQFVACKKHVEDNIKSKLTTLGITGRAKNDFIRDIFGNDSEKHRGLIDSISPEDFDSKLFDLRNTWREREKTARGSNDDKFFDYFQCNIANDMKEKMILTIRRQVGLGDNFFYNNANESMNRRIKQRIEQIKKNNEKCGRANLECTLTEIVDIYKSYVNEVRRNIRRAVLDLGPYTLVEEHAHHKVTSEQWMNMSKEQQEHHVKFIDPCCTEEVEIVGGAARNDTCFEGAEGVSNKFSESGLPEMFRSSWENADLIIGKNGVTAAPGTVNTKVVMSLTNPNKPHFVRIKDGARKFECDCIGFKTRSLCAHTIAVARGTGKLEHLVSTWSPNLSKQLQSELPKSTGRKPGPQRNRHPPQVREIGNHTYSSAGNPDIRFAENDKYSVIPVSKCKSTVCYGCGEKFRMSASDRPPPQPYDILLSKMEYRVYTPRGRSSLKISARKERCYYHVRKACLLKRTDTVSSRDIFVADDVLPFLNRLHKEHLRKEFGIVV